VEVSLVRAATASDGISKFDMSLCHLENALAILFFRSFKALKKSRGDRQGEETKGKHTWDFVFCPFRWANKYVWSTPINTMTLDYTYMPYFTYFKIISL